MYTCVNLFCYFVDDYCSKRRLFIQYDNTLRSWTTFWIRCPDTDWANLFSLRILIDYKLGGKLGWRRRYSDSLRAGRSGDWSQVWVRFSIPVEIGPGLHQASCKIGTASSSGVKQPWLGADHLPAFSAEITNGLELYSATPMCSHRHVMVWDLPLQIRNPLVTIFHGF
jgi:hypothetical protein